MERSLVFVMLAVALIFLVGYAAALNNMVDTPDEEGTIAGFWTGLWPGIIIGVNLPTILSIPFETAHFHLYDSPGFC